jgi:hypothetical protein
VASDRPSMEAKILAGTSSRSAARSVALVTTAVSDKRRRAAGTRWGIEATFLQKL